MTLGKRKALGQKGSEDLEKSLFGTDVTAKSGMPKNILST